MKIYNKLYGILTDGLKTYRATNADQTNLSDYCLSLIHALIPKELTDEVKCGLAELYISLIMTDIESVELLHSKDPYNSYTTVSYDIECPEQNWDKLVQRLKRLRLQDMSDDLTPADYIVITLKHIMEIL
jgi:hypothetical protein